MSQLAADLPTIQSSAYLSQPIEWQILSSAGGNELDSLREYKSAPLSVLHQFHQQHQQQYESMTTTRRIIQVFIADPDINVPLDSALLFRGEQKLTDLTDQELFFEVPISDLLAKHNEKRAKWLDKDATKKAGKDVLLEPARIRDLKMTVVNIAAF